jgi:uncharacterized iron-regulated protein
MRWIEKKQVAAHHPGRARRRLQVLALLWAAGGAGLLGGCAMPSKPDAAGTETPAPAAGSIISGRSGAGVSFEEMLADLLSARIVYVGEKHTSAPHHEVQLRVIRALHEHSPGLAVGLEMFDRSYQAALDRWSAGSLEEEEFLRRTHWYANWRFDYALYRDILAYAKSHRLRLVALNLPFNIPPKIRVGGLDYLSEHEMRFLPRQVDTTVAAHREFAEKVFAMHGFSSGVRFEDFYAAQCVWEEVMAESVALTTGSERMVVLAGNGHIQYSYGIPERAFRRNGLAYRTIYSVTAGESVDPAIADYIWFTD